MNQTTAFKCGLLCILLVITTTSLHAQLKASFASSTTKMQQYLAGRAPKWSPAQFRKVLSGSKSQKTVQGNGVTYSITNANTRTIPGTSGSVSTKRYDGGSIICQEQYKTLENIFHAFDNSSTEDFSKIYPGAIYTDISVIGRPFSQGGLSGMQRQPMKIYIDLYDPTSTNHVEKIMGDPITNPTAGNIEAKIQDLLSNNLKAGRPAMVMPTLFEITSGIEFNASYKSSISLDLMKLLALIAPEVSIPAALADLKVAASNSISAEASARQQLHFYYAEMKEIFYTVNLDTHPSDLVSGTTVPGNAVACTSVSYGRKWIFLIASVESLEQIQAAMNGALSLAGIAEGSQNTSVSFKAIANAAFARGVFLGGNAEDAVAASFDDFSQFKNFVKRTPWTPAVKGFPVQYTFDYLDGTPLNVSIKTINPFLEQNCTRATNVVNVELVNLSPTIVIDAPGLPPDEELFGDIKVEASYIDETGETRKVNSTNTINTIWEVSKSDAKKRSVNQGIKGTTVLQYKFFPQFINQSKIKLIFNVRDKIESGAESLGQSESAIKNGVKYSLESREIGVKDISTSGTIVTLKGKEGLAEVVVTVKLKAN